jgi:GAF domain-containing protein
MISVLIPADESARLKAVEEYKLLATDPLLEAANEEITRMAAEICGTPVAFIGLVDEANEWFTAKLGLEMDQVPRQYSFCGHAIAGSAPTMVVEDARYDQRFFNNPLTTGDPGIIFYAGVPLMDSQGFALGALVVADSRPRKLSDSKLMALQLLARLAETQLELEKTKKQLHDALLVSRRFV